MVFHAVVDPSGKEHKIELDEAFAWFAPYLKAASKLGVPLWRVKRIRGYKVPADKIERQKAQISREGSYFVISLLKEFQEYHNEDGKVKVGGYTPANWKYKFEDTLDSLAHELSHTCEGCWEHTAERFVVEKKLQLAFARLARRKGYKGYGD